MLITVCAIAIAGALLAFAAWTVNGWITGRRRRQEQKLAAEIARIKSAPAGALGYIFRKP